MGVVVPVKKSKWCQPRASVLAAQPVFVSALLALVCGSARMAAAQEFCVQCLEPPALYRCVLDGARPGVVPSLQLLCVQRMATQGGHASCSVKRGVTVFDCDAPVKRVTVDDGRAAPTEPVANSGPGPSSTSVPGSTAPENPATAKVPTGPVGAISGPGAAPPQKNPSTSNEPTTVLEVAKRAQAATDKEMKKTGDGFKKAWDCVASLFKRCGAAAE
jgi:hypothetical protein